MTVLPACYCLLLPKHPAVTHPMRIPLLSAGEARVRVVVEVMLKPEILDPQGGAVLSALPRLGVSGVRSVRQGKRFELDVDGEPDMEQIHQIAHGFLSNPVIEDYTVHLRAEYP